MYRFGVELPTHLAEVDDRHRLQDFLIATCIPDSILNEQLKKPDVSRQRLFRRYCWSDPVNGKIVLSLLCSKAEAEEAQEKMKRNRIRFKEIGINVEKVVQEDTVFLTLSPIYVKNGQGKSPYPPRYQKEFERILLKNLMGKAKQFGLEVDQKELKFEMVISPFIAKRKYGNLELSGLKCGFRLQGLDPSLRLLAYGIGLGGRNAQGFGLIGVLSF